LLLAEVLAVEIDMTRLDANANERRKANEI
jgi:hypothetical protein